MASNPVTVAAVQLTSGADPVLNVERAIALITRAAEAGATYVQVPEYFSYRGPAKGFATVAEAVPGPTTTQMGELAKELKITVHLGSLAETSPRPGQVFNTGVVLAPSGEIAATYRKGHLFDVSVRGEVEHRESDHVAAGDQLAVVQLDEFALGLSICFDLRFAELYRQLALHGATVLAVPSSFAVATGRAHWELLLRARAVENHAFVVAAAQAGTTSEGLSSYGHSLIVDPWGEIVAESSEEGEDVLVATIDLDEVRRRRSQISVLTLRRPDLYRSLGDVGE